MTEMPLRWEAGRQQIDRLLGERRLERVTASRAMADHLLVQAGAHLSSASAVAQGDPEGGYALAYDAARKALSAVLENQGLRVRSMPGHHKTLYEAVLAQLHPPLGPQLRPFDHMRQLRREAEYPQEDRSGLHAEDVEDAVTSARTIVEVCTRVLDSMPAY